MSADETVDASTDDADDTAVVEDGARTVDALVELGVPREDAERAVAEDSVALVLAARALDEPSLYRRRDLAEASGLDEDVVADLFQAAGHQEELYTQSDLEASHLLAQLLEVMPLDALVRITRARAIALSSVARAEMSLVRDHLVLPLREAGADDLTIAVALAEHAAELDRLSRRLLVHEHRNHIRRLLRSELSVLAANTGSPAITACIGFVDLVGYTQLAARVDPHGLDDLLDTFEQRVMQAAATESEVTVVKFLGDAAMFVSTELRPLVDVLLRLSTKDSDGDEVPIRGGIARGDVLLREGDYFGTAVNVAARLTDIARPWSLLADDDLKPALRDHYELRRTRPVNVRGLGTRRPLVVRASFELGGDDDEVPPVLVP